MTDVASNPGTRRFIRPIEEADLNLAIAKVRRQLKVFIAGPYIRKDWSDEDRLSKPAAALLRIFLLNNVEQVLGHSAILGEHRGVLETGDERLRSRSSPLVTEMALARDVDAIVIVPSSPGSFCELGSWVIHEIICKKMVILADQDHKEKGGYVALGVFKTAIDHGAQLNWIDYTDQATAASTIADFIRRIEDAVLSRSILNGGS